MKVKDYKSNYHKNKRFLGFTFLELTLVVALISIITLFSVAFYSRFLTQNAVGNTVDQLVFDFRKAQSYAMSGRKSGNWGVSYGSNLITLYYGNSFGNRTQALDEKFNINSNITINPSAFDINFVKTTGLPNMPITITISGNNNTKTISLNEMGVVDRQ